jgi:hypothetical protein
MKSKKELIREYKERKKPAGVYQIKNNVNGKVLLGSSLDLDGVLNSHRFRLDLGRHPNEALQKEWKDQRAGDFAFEILEIVKESENPGFNVSDELALLEEIWAEKLEPFGERGYNTDAEIRKV